MRHTSAAYYRDQKQRHQRPRVSFLLGGVEVKTGVGESDSRSASIGSSEGGTATGLVTGMNMSVAGTLDAAGFSLIEAE